MGRALKFFASVRINVRSGERIHDPKNKDNIIGHQINASIVKNKTALPFKKASFDLIYAVGVDKVKETADIATLIGVVNRAGAYYQIKDEEGNKVVRTANGREVEMSFQGKDAFVEYLKSDEELYHLLYNAIMTGETVSLDEIRGTPLEQIEEEVTEE